MRESSSLRVDVVSLTRSEAMIKIKRLKELLQRNQVQDKAKIEQRMKVKRRNNVEIGVEERMCEAFITDSKSSKLMSCISQLRRGGRMASVRVCSCCLELLHVTQEANMYQIMVLLYNL
ncbi:hypothetical protein HA466_0097910 [Hirschfeldia incana]|nr:hypothetical protein HA466_0097910 [Hirschfeldia incana]